MKTILKATVAISALCFTYLSFALTLAPPGTSPISPVTPGVEISASDLREVMESTANATLNPDGSATKSNCRKDAHCVALPFSNNCGVISFSTYKSRGAENTITSLAILHDLTLPNTSICARAVTEGACVEERCTFEETGEIAL